MQASAGMEVHRLENVGMLRPEFHSGLSLGFGKRIGTAQDLLPVEISPRIIMAQVDAAEAVLVELIVPVVVGPFRQQVIEYAARFVFLPLDHRPGVFR